VARAIAHPVVVCISSRGNLLQTFVVLEGQVTECPSLLSAVDRAFKLHFIVNIAYVSASEHMWQLLQKLAYTIHENSSTYACVTDLIAYTIRYDSVYLTCSKRLTGSQLSLPHIYQK